MAENRNKTTTKNAQDVYKAELNEIAKRRNRLQQHQPHPKASSEKEIRDNLVGLALSGGGVRSGALSVGLIQSLERERTLKDIDYCSSVSGGSYAAAFLASQAIGHRDLEDEKNPSLDLCEDDNLHGKQSERILDLVFSSKYLRDTLGFFNRQLFGMFLMLTIAISGLLCLSSAVAWFARHIDDDQIRDALTPLGFTTEFRRAFVPFFGMILLWIAAWAISYWRRTSAAPNNGPRFVFYGLVFSFAVSIALVLGSGDLYFGPSASQVKLHDWAVYLINQLWVFVFAAIGASLIPYLSPRKLITSGEKPRNIYEKLSFFVATRGLLIGIPFAFLLIMLSENISGWNDLRSGKIIARSELKNWSAGLTYSPFWKKVFAQRETVPALSEKTPAQKSETSHIFDQETFKGVSAKEILKEPLASKEKKENSNQDAMANKTDDKQSTWKKITKEFTTLYGINNEIQTSFGKSPQIFACWWAYTHSWVPGVDATENKYKHYQKLLNQSNNAKNEIVKILGESMEKPGFPNMLGLTLQKSTKKQDGPIDKLTSIKIHPEALTSAAKEKRAAIQSKLREIVALEKTYNSRKKTPENDEKNNYLLGIKKQLANANRELLILWCPKGVEPTATVKSFVCYEKDQAYRLFVLKVSLIVFLFSIVVVNLNKTSCHSFYRTKLAKMWIDKVPGFSKEKIPLSQLETCDNGYPYHLIVGSSSLLMSLQKPKERDPIDHFVFSQHYCGSERTGFCKSSSLSTSGFFLSDAVAISGGAISVLHVTNPLIVFLLFVCNLRLGQWIRNPGQCNSNESVWSRAFGLFGVTPIRLMLSVFQQPENRPFVFVADGGHFDNLAIDELLRRRCKLIFA